jgi:GNAT superfamily N-acetyltransferase
MPEEFIGTHDKPSTGTPIRLFVIDTNEERRFNTIPGEIGIFMSDDGEKGYIGYHDYQIEDDGNVTPQGMYIHPFHRRKGIAKKILLHIESISEEGTIFREHTLVDLSLHNRADEANARGKITVIYTKPTVQ